MSMHDMLRQFAWFHGNRRFVPVHIGYRNMERILNVKSLGEIVALIRMRLPNGELAFICRAGNLNRQFVSLLRSEQDSSAPVIGDPSVWEQLTFDPQRKRLLRLQDAFAGNLLPAQDSDRQTETGFLKQQYRRVRTFPYWTTVKWLVCFVVMLSSSEMQSHQGVAKSGSYRARHSTLTGDTFQLFLEQQSQKRFEEEVPRLSLCPLSSAVFLFSATAHPACANYKS